MTNKTKYIAIAALLLNSVFSLSAQSLRAGYFSDSYLYRHNINPALGNDRNYVGLPAISNLRQDIGMNFGISNFIKKDATGNLVTFMHESVGTNDFISELPDVAKVMENLDMNIFSVGWVTKKSYNTFTIGAHAQAGFALPKGMFTFLKEMDSSKPYDFNDLRVRAHAYADIAYGNSRNYTDDFRFGFKVKALLGIGYANTNINNFNAYFGADKWTANLDGSLEVAGGDGHFTRDNNGYVDGYKDFKPGVNGLGAAIDLGATYDMQEWVNGLKLSLAVTDIGFIKWNDISCANNSGNSTFEFDGFNNITFSKDEPQSLKNQWNDIKDDLDAMAKFKSSYKESVNQKLGTTLTAGVEYEIPAYKKVSFGMLYTQRFDDVFNFNECRVVANYGPSSYFDISASAAINTWGTTYGALLNLSIPGINIFFGTDYIYTGSVNKNYVPLEKGGLNFQIGFNFAFLRDDDDL